MYTGTFLAAHPEYADEVLTGPDGQPRLTDQSRGPFLRWLATDERYSALADSAIARYRERLQVDMKFHESN
jgi:hypothetical protein